MTMVRIFKRARPALWAAPVLLLVACQMIAGIEGDDYVALPPASAQCVAYCESVEKACTGASSVYNTHETCLGACAQMVPGVDSEPGQTNTVACRANEAKAAGGGGERPQDHCPAAGPGGAGICGTNCASYCAIFKNVCPSLYAASCEAQCVALPDTRAFNSSMVGGNYDGDTIQCRLVHLSAASVSPAAAAIHCAHAQLRPTPQHCFSPAGGVRDCQADCTIIQTACTGPNAVYESAEQCSKVCAVLPAGLPADTDTNTSWCRRYHGYNALLDSAEGHCPHAGPLGDGHCGADMPDKTGNCESFCTLARAGCPLAFAAKYGADDSACQKECSNQPPEFGAKTNAPTRYSVVSVDGTSTLQCRALYAVRAVTQRDANSLVDPAACANVFGGPQCP